VTDRLSESAISTGWMRKHKWLKKVARTPERDLRGHRIALTYHGLAINLLTWIHDIKPFDQDAVAHSTPRLNIPWFGFATWATATLNADIRNDGPPYRSDRIIPLGFRRRFTPTVLAIKAANGQRYQQLLTWYQRVVFINTTFTYRALRKQDPKGKKVWARINAKGEITTQMNTSWMNDAKRLTAPPGASSALDVERHFKPVLMAFEYYRRARRISLLLNHSGKKMDPAVREYYETLRARLIFFGNLIITSVEQDLVDPGVERVLNNVPTAANDVASAHLADLAQRMLGVPRQLAGLRIPARLQPAETAFREVWVRLLTSELLVLALPTETLRLGRDVPPVDAGDPYFPNELFDLGQLPGDLGKLFPTVADDNDVAKYVHAFEQHARDNRDLFQTVMAFDRSRGEGFGTGARDWRRIVERMNWATTMLRTRIQEASVLWPPFRDEDAERIMKGRLPLHPGNPTDFDVLGPLEGFTYLSGGGSAAFGEEASR
jgi:hypothetical protein